MLVKDAAGFENGIGGFEHHHVVLVCKCNHLWRCFFATGKQHGVDVGHLGGTNGLHVRQSGYQQGAASIQRQHVAHQIGRKSMLDDTVILRITAHQAGFE